MEMLDQFLERIPCLFGVVPCLDKVRLCLGVGFLVERQTRPEAVLAAEQLVKSFHCRLDTIEGGNASFLGDLAGGLWFPLFRRLNSYFFALSGLKRMDNKCRVVLLVCSGFNSWPHPGMPNEVGSRKPLVGFSWRMNP